MTLPQTTAAEAAGRPCPPCATAGAPPSPAAAAAPAPDGGPVVVDGGTAAGRHLTTRPSAMAIGMPCAPTSTRIASGARRASELQHRTVKYALPVRKSSRSLVLVPRRPSPHCTLVPAGRPLTREIAERSARTIRGAAPAQYSLTA